MLARNSNLILSAAFLCFVITPPIVQAEPEEDAEIVIQHNDEISEPYNAAPEADAEPVVDMEEPPATNPAETLTDDIQYPDDDEVSHSSESDLRRFELIPEVYRYKYTERIGVRDRGWKYGLRGTYTFRIAEHDPIESLHDFLNVGAVPNVFKADVRGSYGKVDYDGSGTVNDIPDYNFEGRLTAGYDIAFNRNIRLTPYVGAGYRYLFNDFSIAPANSTTYSGYDRESTYFYIPLGAETQIKMNRGWALLLTGEFDFLVSGTQNSHLEDMHDDTGANPGYSELKNEQNDGIGWRMAVRLQKETPRFDLFTESFIRYWHIKDSEFSPISINGVLQCAGNLCNGGIEPDNKTWEIGVNLGAKF